MCQQRGFYNNSNNPGRLQREKNLNRERFGDAVCFPPGAATSLSWPSKRVSDMTSPGRGRVIGFPRGLDIRGAAAAKRTKKGPFGGAGAP